MDRLFSRIADENYPDRHAPEVRHVDYATLSKAPHTWGTRFPIIADSSMPPGYFELRTDTRRVGCWSDGAANHDPGDEDRSER